MINWFRSRSRRFRFGALVLVAPALTFYGALVLAPIVGSLVYSLTDWDGISPSFQFVGLENYAEALQDPLVQTAFIVTFVITIVCTVILNALAIPIAVVLDHSDLVTRLYRSVLILPIVISAVIIGLVWKIILGTGGVMNTMLAGFGGGPFFLADPALSVLSIMFVATWQTLGFLVVLYLAALQGISREVYESARMDGATGRQMFWHITVPMLAPAMTINVTLIVVVFMRLYDTVQVMTIGGPGTATYTVAFLLVRKSLDSARFGYGSSIGIVLLVVVCALSAGLLTTLRRRERWL